MGKWVLFRSDIIQITCAKTNRFWLERNRKKESNSKQEDEECQRKSREEKGKGRSVDFALEFQLSFSARSVSFPLHFSSPLSFYNFWMVE